MSIYGMLIYERLMSTGVPTDMVLKRFVKRGLKNAYT